MSDKPSSEGATGGATDVGRPDNETACPLTGSAADAACPIGPAPPESGSGPEEIPEAGDKPGAMGEARTGRLAALIYTGISLLAALLFVVATTLAGGYPAVARYGGAAWVFVLTMIVLMPFVIPRVRKWRG